MTPRRRPWFCDNTWMNAPAADPRLPPAEAIYAELREQLSRTLRASGARRPHLIGVHSGGAWIARRLHADLALPTPLGTLSSMFHRDDYGRRGLPSDPKATDLPFEIAGADIVLVDDILYTGRTVRAALNELFDYGRPDRVEFAVLIDRGGRELPIEARYCGARIDLPADRNLVLTQDGDGRFLLDME